MATRKRKSRKKKPPALVRHFDEIGFTNRLAVALVLLLFIGLAGGFVLAVLSIRHQYNGALACWTIVFTPIGTAISVVLACVVQKSKAENTGANGEGIKYAQAMLEAAAASEDTSGSSDSPKI